jgi:hypothetical protein
MDSPRRGAQSVSIIYSLYVICRLMLLTTFLLPA